jgi:hypothetical protein
MYELEKEKLQRKPQKKEKYAKRSHDFLADFGPKLGCNMEISSRKRDRKTESFIKIPHLISVSVIILHDHD